MDAQKAFATCLKKRGIAVLMSLHDDVETKQVVLRISIVIREMYQSD